MQYKPVEKRLLNEYMDKHFQTNLQWRNVRLGPVGTAELAKLYKVTRRWADGVAFDGSQVYIIEAKMFADPGAIGQLEQYKDLFFDTPEFSQYHSMPVKLVFLTTKEDPVLRRRSTEKGIDYIVFEPAWVKEWWYTKAAKQFNYRKK